MGEGLVLIVFLVVVLRIYLFPTWLAHSRGHRNFGSICATNVLLGWTFVGWWVCFAWSLS